MGGVSTTSSPGETVAKSPGETVAKTQPLCTDAEFNVGDRVLGEGEKNSFIALPGKGGHSGLMPIRLCPALEGVSEESCSSSRSGAWSARGPSSDWLVVR